MQQPEIYMYRQEALQFESYIDSEEHMAINRGTKYRHLFYVINKYQENAINVN